MSNVLTQLETFETAGIKSYQENTSLRAIPCRKEVCPDVEGLIGRLEDAQGTVLG